MEELLEEVKQDLVVILRLLALNNILEVDLE